MAPEPLLVMMVEAVAEAIVDGLELEASVLVMAVAVAMTPTLTTQLNVTVVTRTPSKMNWTI
ncbi:hypothetical protein PF010_g2583 [Phytophthora fragariae]|uniref:Uncharacterized protein n=1 Tax=Phytophthora fragariae TaxID=53985 RepID=A0A6G0LXQ0_9STRA|nr:hypothetical protein PF010_g2583 [Phytophthora fragariae]KAE9179692.1 hypothetical protein PF004_g25074 [Phytophthora fragariae]